MGTTTGENRQRYAASVETAPSRFINDGQDYREWAGRADKFAQVWADQELIVKHSETDEPDEKEAHA